MTTSSCVRALAAAAALLLHPSAATAQVSQSCAAQGQLQDACQQAADIFALLAPQLGTAVAGGNATPGLQGALGQFGRVALGVRLNGVRGSVPRASELDVALGPARSSEIVMRDQLITMPQADLAFGLFPGIPLQFSYVGAIDLLVSGSWLPRVRLDDVHLRTTDNSFRLGAGVRVGVIQESSVAPGIAISYLRRGLPTAQLSVRAGDDTLSVSDVRVTTDSWRVVAGKNLFGFVLAAGIGQDEYDTRAAVSAVVNEGGGRFATAEPVAFAQRLTRTNAFGNATWRIGIVRFAAELGSAWGGDVPTMNTFQGTTADASRVYGSLGLRVGF